MRFSRGIIVDSYVPLVLRSDSSLSASRRNYCACCYFFSRFVSFYSNWFSFPPSIIRVSISHVADDGAASVDVIRYTYRCIRRAVVHQEDHYPAAAAYLSQVLIKTYDSVRAEYIGPSSVQYLEFDTRT